MIRTLIQKIKATNAPIVVGLDPAPALIPPQLLEKAYDTHGQNLEAMGEAIWQYNRAIVDAVYDLIPAVKPQIAMYEQYGLPGLLAYAKTVAYCKEKGLVVIGDIKRGDIGSTSKSYAMGHLGKVQVGEQRLATSLEVDFCTVNPYMGSDSVVPFVEVCKEEDKGLFVLVKTSNPSSGEFQDRLIDGRPLYQLVADKVNEWGADMIEDGYSNIGAVVGATYPEMGAALRAQMPQAYILVPGYGAQGGAAKDLKPFFNADGLGAIVNSSRGIIAAYQQPAYREYGAEQFAQAARAAVIAMREDIASIF
ncbi:MAG: orotidine-5'-phosphate decarboxylase [Eubacteriales bacterium]|nr:orotidine-5'-phosphate decarboxylase [Eubacteriales bacterium]